MYYRIEYEKKVTNNLNIITAVNISKSFGEKPLFSDVNLTVTDQDKIGIIGINGTGKSTLLNVIASKISPDTGEIQNMPGITIEYLNQEPVFHEEETVLSQVFSGEGEIFNVLRQYEIILKSAQEYPEDIEIQKQLIKLTGKMDALDAWDLEAMAKTILTKLGITQFNDKIKTLSGGQRKRVAMATSLITPCDLLILDEPTNHIDNETSAWLESHLKERRGALLMVTHDRYFLERVTNKIFEIDRGTVYSYPVNYSKFLEMKAMRRDLEEIHDEKRRKTLEKELAWMRKGAKARTTKQKARIERYENLKNEAAFVPDQDIEIKAVSQRLGNKIIDIVDLSKAYDDNILIKNFSYQVKKNDRIGIIGKNGFGKSTFLKMIAGKVDADHGEIDIGETVKIGFLSQEYTIMDENLRTIEFIRESHENIQTEDGHRISASEMLETFLFPKEEQWTPIHKLSGGEKRRLMLLKILMEQPNVLLLDEPTNDLDLATLSVLEEYLESFPGAVLTVSHDRYFLDRTSEKIFSFEGEGAVDIFYGNYSDYEDKKALEEKEGAVEEKVKTSVSKVMIPEKEKEKKKPKKFTYNEQREFETIDERVMALEEKVQKLEEEINLQGADFIALEKLLKEKEVADKHLEEAMERWTYLHELAEELGL